MSDQREILNEAEVDFLLAGAAEETAVPPASVDVGRQTVTMHGDLEQINLADIFQTLAMSKMEGVLRVCNPLEERQIYCCDGRVRILVPPRLTTRRLGQRLVHAGLLEPEQLRTALLEQRKDKVPLGKLLVRQGAVTQEQIDQIIETQIAEDLFALFTWQHGSFEFYKGEAGNNSQAEHFAACPEYEINSLLLEVARRSDEWESILAAIRSLDEIPTRIADPQDDSALDEVHQAVLASVDGRTSFRNIAFQTTHGLFEVARAARDLVNGGILAGLDDAAMVLAAQSCIELGEPKKAIVVLQTLRDRPGERSVPTLRRMAQVLETTGERRLASALLLEAAQRSPSPEDSIELARAARKLQPYDAATLSFLRTVLIAHDRPDSPELEKCTIDLLDALIEGDLLTTALEIVDDARRTKTVGPQILIREARARQKARDLPGAIDALLELARLSEEQGNRGKAVEAYQMVLRLDRSRRDVQKALTHLQSTRMDRLIRAAATVVVAALVGGAGFVYVEQRRRDSAVAEATADIAGLLAEGNRAVARERLAHWHQRLGDCEAIEDLNSRVAFAEAAELGRLAKLRRARINEQLTEAAAALERGELGNALSAYERLWAEPGLAGEVAEIAQTRITALLDEVELKGRGLDSRLPPAPSELFSRRELATQLADLQAHCPPALLRSFRELDGLAGSGQLPGLISAAQRSRIERVVAENRAPIVRARELTQAYTQALQRNETQRRLDPMFKAAVERETRHDFAGALELFRELEQQPAGDPELRAHFRDRVARNATIVRMLAALTQATDDGDHATAQQHLRALRLSFPDVPFDRLARLPIAIDSEPTGAVVTCNGKEAGRTPTTLTRLPAEDTRIVVQLEGFRSVATTITGDGAPKWTGRLVLEAARRWQRDSAVEQPPVASPGGGYLLVDRAGNLLSLDDALQPRWTFASLDLSGWLTAPLVVGKLALLGSLDGDFRALALDTGTLRWSLPGLPTEVQPALLGDTVFLATTDRKLHAINVAQQRRLAVDLPETVQDTLLAHGDRVIALSQRGSVFAHAAADLALAWRASWPELSSPRGGLVRDLVVAADDQGRVVAWRARTGEELWRRSLSTLILGRPVALSGQIALVTPSRVLRLDAATGQDRPPIQAPEQEWSGEASLVAGRLLVPLRDGTIQVLDLDQGRTVYRLEGGKRSRVLPAKDGLFIALQDHTLLWYPQLR